MSKRSGTASSQSEAAPICLKQIESRLYTRDETLRKIGAAVLDELSGGYRFMNNSRTRCSGAGLIVIAIDLDVGVLL